MKKKWLGPLVRITVSALLITYVCTLIQFKDVKATRFVLRSSKEAVAGIVLEREGGRIRVQPLAGKPVLLDITDVASESTFVQKGFLTLLSEMDLRIYLPISLIWFVPFLIDVERWRVLLRVQGLRIGFFDALRLTYIGIFLSNILPGVTGGDVAKAVLLAPSTQRKTRMVTSVMADRVIGLIALAFVAAVVILFHLGDPVFHGPAKLVALFLGGATVFFTLYYNKRLRATRLFLWIRDEMPGHQIVREIDEAVHDFRSARKAMAWTFVLSLGAHTSTILAGYGFAQALGISHIRVEHYFSFVPLIAITAALPISISGWGVAEGGYALFFKTVLGPLGVAAEVAVTQAVTLSILGRLTTIAYSVPGGLCLMFAKSRYAVREETVAGMAEGAETTAGEPQPSSPPQQPPPPGLEPKAST
ncbi:MAG: flippase-like domain-containing protein [Planctomycetes bacterium]|nr:flippase-like domain-containing protein [Planctomycetota bacterium]